MLVAAMDPTPGGKMPGESHCSPREIQDHLNRLSGLLLDRIDLHIEVPTVNFTDITSRRNGELSATIRERVIAAPTSSNSASNIDHGSPVTREWAHANSKPTAPSNINSGAENSLDPVSFEKPG